MKIIINNEESEQYFLSAICNGGLIELGGYGIQLDYSEADYIEAKKSILVKNLSIKNSNDDICVEDVWMEMLRMGKTLRFVDTEEAMDTVELTLNQIHERIPQIPNDCLQAYNSENDDAGTADVLLQYLLYGEIIFG